MSDSALKNIFRSLKYRNYRLFFSGQTISLIGTWIQRIAVPWMVYRLTGSAFLLGVFGFAGQIPTFILAPFTGVLVDRYNRYYILIAAQFLAMLQALVLALLYYSGIIQIWHLMVASIFLGVVTAFDMPARQSMVVDMIEKKEDLGNAIALNSSMVNGARLVGPSIAGILIATSGEGLCFLLNGLSYIFVIAFLFMMRIPPRKIKAHTTNVLHGLKEGFNYAYGFPPIRYVILLFGFVSLMGMPYMILMPVFAKQILHGGSHTFGFLMAATGTGALSGAIYLASRKNVVGLNKLIALAAATFGLGLVLFSLSHFFLLSLLLLLIVGAGMMMLMASANTITQTLVDDDKRGRVMSFYAMAFTGAAPIGSLIAGSLAGTIGAPNTLLIGGISCIIGAFVFARKLPTLNKLVHPIYMKMGIIPEVAAGIQSATDLTAPPE